MYLTKITRIEYIALVTCMSKEIQEEEPGGEGMHEPSLFCMQIPPALLAGRQFHILWEKFLNEGNR